MSGRSSNATAKDRKNEKKAPKPITEKEKAVVEDVKILAEEVKQLAEDSDKLANDTAVVSSDAKEVIKEVVEILTSHPDMCHADLFGTIDENSDECKNCIKDFAECANACKILRDSKNIKPVKVKKEGTARKTGARGVNTFVASVYAAWIAKELTYEKFTELGIKFETVHTPARHKAYIKYFEDGKYSPKA